MLHLYYNTDRTFWQVQKRTNLRYCFCVRFCFISLYSTTVSQIAASMNKTAATALAGANTLSLTPSAAKPPYVLLMNAAKAMMTNSAMNTANNSVSDGAQQR